MKPAGWRSIVPGFKTAGTPKAKAKAKAEGTLVRAVDPWKGIKEGKKSHHRWILSQRKEDKARRLKV